MDEKGKIKQFNVLQSDGTTVEKNVSVDAENVDMPEGENLLDKIAELEEAIDSKTDANIPAATAEDLGVVKAGEGLNVTNGELTIAFGDGPGTACAGDDPRLGETVPETLTIGEKTYNGTEPVEMSLAPLMHASNDKEYGVATKGVYGHIKVGSGLEVEEGVVSLDSAVVQAISESVASEGGGGISDTDPRLYNARKNPEKLSFNGGSYDGSEPVTLNSNSLGLAPVAHASTVTKYGVGTSSEYGHLKISDDYAIGDGASDIAASNKAIHDLTNGLLDGSIRVAKALSVDKIDTITNAQNAEKFGAQFPSYYAKESEVEEILDGTTPVAQATNSNNADLSEDSEKLGGEEPSFYAKSEGLANVINGTTKIAKAAHTDNSDKLGGYYPSHYATSLSVANIENGNTRVPKASNSLNSDKLGNQEPAYYATKKDVENIVDGTTVISGTVVSSDNANKLDNHFPSYFATKEDINDLLNGTTTSAKSTRSINANNADKLGDELPSFYATKQEIEDIIDGTTTMTGTVTSAENSNQLDGHLPAFYAKESQIVDIQNGTQTVGHAILADNATQLGSKDPEYYASASDVEGIIDGTIPIEGTISHAANADTLGNELPSHYATKEELDNLTNGVTTSAVDNANKLGNQLPSYYATKAQLDNVINGTTEMEGTIANATNAKKFGNQLPDYYAKDSEVEALKTTTTGLSNGTIKAGHAVTADSATNATKLGGQLPSYYSTKEALDDVIDGTTPIQGTILNAENSKKLDGKLPSYYAKESEWTDGTKKIKAKSLDVDYSHLVGIPANKPFSESIDELYTENLTYFEFYIDGMSISTTISAMPLSAIFIGTVQVYDEENIQVKAWKVDTEDKRETYTQNKVAGVWKEWKREIGDLMDGTTAVEKANMATYALTALNTTNAETATDASKLGGKLPEYYLNKTELETFQTELEDGTIIVDNANKLNGQDASNYLLTADIQNGTTDIDVKGLSFDYQDLKELDGTKSITDNVLALSLGESQRKVDFYLITTGAVSDMPALIGNQLYYGTIDWYRSNHYKITTFSMSGDMAIYTRTQTIQGLSEWVSEKSTTLASELIVNTEAITTTLKSLYIKNYSNVNFCLSGRALAETDMPNVGEYYVGTVNFYNASYFSVTANELNATKDSNTYKRVCYNNVWGEWKKIVFEDVNNPLLTESDLTESLDNFVIPRITYSNNGFKIFNPELATSPALAGSLTGAIDIALPSSILQVFVSLTARVQTRTEGESFDVICQGYYYSGVEWMGCSASIIGSNLSENYTVRFGFDTSTKTPHIYIGELTSTWTLLTVSILDITVRPYLASYISTLGSDYTEQLSTGVAGTMCNYITGTSLNCVVGFGSAIDTSSFATQTDITNLTTGVTEVAKATNATNADKFGDQLPSYYVTKEEFQASNTELEIQEQVDNNTKDIEEIKNGEFGAKEEINLFGNLGADSYKWNACALAPNGKVYGAPYNSSSVLEIDPKTQTTTLFSSLNGKYKWYSATTAPNGKIYCLPYMSRQVLEIDPETRTTALLGSAPGTGTWIGSVLAPNGKIYGMPFTATQILEFDPTTKSLTLVGSSIGGNTYRGGVLASNGKIYGIPYSATTAFEFDPETGVLTTFGFFPSSNKWYGGVLAPNGKIYGIPYTSTQVLEIDPETKTTTLFGDLAGTSKWDNGVLAPNGKIYGIPSSSTKVLEIDPEKNTTRLLEDTLSGSFKWATGLLAPNRKIYGMPSNSSQVLEMEIRDFNGIFGDLEQLETTNKSNFVDAINEIFNLNSDTSSFATQTDITNLITGVTTVAEATNAISADDADMLGGQLPEYYATKEDLENFEPASSDTGGDGGNTSVVTSEKSLEANNAIRFGGQLPEYYAKLSDIPVIEAPTNGAEIDDGADITVNSIYSNYEIPINFPIDQLITATIDSRSKTAETKYNFFIPFGSAAAGMPDNSAYFGTVEIYSDTYILVRAHKATGSMGAEYGLAKNNNVWGEWEHIAGPEVKNTIDMSIYAEQTSLDKVISGETPVTVVSATVPSTFVTLATAQNVATYAEAAVANKSVGYVLHWFINNGAHTDLPFTDCAVGSIEKGSEDSIYITTRTTTGHTAAMNKRYVKSRSLNGVWSAWKEIYGIETAVTADAISLGGYSADYFASQSQIESLASEVATLKTQIYAALGVEEPDETAETAYALKSDLDDLISGKITIPNSPVVDNIVTLSKTTNFQTSMLNLPGAKQARGTTNYWRIEEGNTAGMPFEGSWSGTADYYNVNYITINAHCTSGTADQVGQEYYMNKSYFEGWGSWIPRATITPTVSATASSLNGYDASYYATQDSITSLQEQISTLNEQLNILQAQTTTT